VTACAWGAIVWRLAGDPALPAVLLFAALATVLALVDMAEHRLPNRVMAPCAGAIALLLVAAAQASGEWSALLWAVIGGVGTFAMFLLVAVLSPPAMGMGDVKLAGVIGLVLAWFGFEAWLTGLVGGFVLGALVAVLALTRGDVRLGDAIPFGPSMLAGALTAILVWA